MVATCGSMMVVLKMLRKVRVLCTPYSIFPKLGFGITDDTGKHAPRDDIQFSSPSSNHLVAAPTLFQCSLSR